MKVKNKITRRIIVAIAIISVITILTSNLLSIVHATSTMTKNENNLTITDFDGNDINLEREIQHIPLTTINPSEDTTFTGFNGVNYEMVNLNSARTADSKYGFSFSLNENTRMEIWKEGFTDTIEYKKLRENETADEVKDITFFPSNDEQSSKFGVYIYNAGLYTYKDESDNKFKICNINLKLTFSWEAWKVNGISQFPFINVRTYSVGSDKYGLFFSFTNMSYATNIEIFEGDPKQGGKKRNVDMNMTLIDIDDRQFFGVGKFNNEGEAGLSEHINKIQYTTDSNVYSDNLPNTKYADYVWFYADADSDVNKENHSNVIQDSVRLELKDVNSFSFVTGTKHDPCSYNYGNRYYLRNDENDYYGSSSVNYGNKETTNSVMNKIMTRINNYINPPTPEQERTNPDAMVGYFTNEPYFPYDISQPFERINDKVNEFFNVESEIGKSQVYSYKVYHYVTNVYKEQYLSSYRFSTKVPLADEYNNTKIYKFLGYNTDGTENLEEVTSNFTVNYNEESKSITATANANILTTNDFYNNIYVMIVSVTEKSINVNNDGAAIDSDNITKTYTLDHKSRVEATSSNSAITLTNQDTNTVHTRYKEIKIPITKVWNDNSNAANLRPAEVTFNVKNPAGQVVSTGTINSNTNTANSDFIPLKNANEEIIQYTIEEEPVPNYNTNIEYTKNGDQITKVTITNTLTETPKATGIVNYYLKGSNPLLKLRESRNLSNLTIGDTLTAETYKENISNYTYNSSNPTTLTVGESGNEINLYYTPNYKIEYYYDGVIDDSLTVTETAELGDEITNYTPQTKNGTYELDSENTNRTVPLTIKATDNVMRIYYVKKAEEPKTYTYSVEYYYDTVKDDNATETGTANLGDIITTYTDKSRNGTYELDSENTNRTVPLTIKETDNVMRIYYVKKSEEPDNVHYTINYYYDGVKDETATETGSVKIDTEISYTEKNRNGTYKLDSVNPTSGKIQITEDEDKNIIHVYYVKNENPTTDARIITKYIDKDTGKEIADSKTENTKIGEKYNTEKKDIKDYSYVSDTGNTSGTVNEPEIEVIYYYEPLREIIIKYVDKQTGKEIADPSTNNGKTGDKFDITSKKQEINGYTLVEEPTEKEATYGKEPQTFTYYYSKNSKIIVRYVDEDTGEQIEKEIEKSGTVGQKFDISDTEKNIENYYLVKRPDSLTGKYTENEQIFTFYYRKDPGLANKPIPKTGMNEIIRNTSIIALLIILSNGLRLFVRYKKEEKRSIR